MPSTEVPVSTIALKKHVEKLLNYQKAFQHPMENPFNIQRKVLRKASRTIILARNTVYVIT